MQPTELYANKINELKTQLRAVALRLKWLSFGRLVAFLVAVGFAWKCIDRDPWTLAPLGIVVALIAFAFILRRYQQAARREALLRALLSLNEKELQLATEHISAFDDGQRFADEGHAFAGDLDVFGPASLYQHINRAGTLSGQERLANQLKHPLQHTAAIQATQDVVKDLAGRFEFRQLIAAQASLTGEQPQDRHRLETWFAMPVRFLHNKGLGVLRYISLALTVAAAMVSIQQQSTYPLLVMIFLNGVLLSTVTAKVSAQHRHLSSQEKTLYRFAEILSLIKQESFNARGLQKLQEQAKDADGALRSLARISNALDQRANLLVLIFLQPLFLYDLHCAFAVEKWKTRYQGQVNEWLSVIAQLEAWNSLATFAYNHPAYTYPVVDEEEEGVVATGLCHPLIPAAQCVKNDCTLTDETQFLIITGSNMSGKSTFLRSVGINLVLAMCGAPVGASSFIFAPMQVMTSMRIKDSIAKHTSYFQAELLRLQQIVTALQRGQRVFIILDEILKGTNSEDKLSGSRKLVEKFLRYNCLGMIATHDLELGQLENTYPRQVKNYCFESTINEAGLHFDYRIGAGIARNKNATFLMQQMEII